MRRMWSSGGAAALLIVAGCSQPGDRPATQPSASSVKPADPPPAAESIQLADTDNIFQITFKSDPFPIEAGKPFSLRVDVARRATHSPIGDEAALNVDAAMPEHRHGMNTQPRVTRLGPGQFEVKGMLLHMSGRWEMYFDVVEGAMTRRATHVLELE